VASFKRDDRLLVIWAAPVESTFLWFACIFTLGPRLPLFDTALFFLFIQLQQLEYFWQAGALCLLVGLLVGDLVIIVLK